MQSFKTIRTRYSIFYPYKGMDKQTFKNQYALERMIVWLINPLELNARWFGLLDSGKKIIPGKHFQSPTTKKLTLEINPQEKYTLRLKSLEKIIIKGRPGFLRSYSCTNKKRNAPIAPRWCTFLNFTKALNGDSFLVIFSNISEQLF